MKKQLSPTTINLYRECPKCFWLHMTKEVKRPRGIFPSLPGGIDRVLKAYLDRFRDDGSMPPFLAGDPLMQGARLAQIKMEIGWTDEKTGWRLYGKLDDCLEWREKKLFAPLDHKTRGSEPGLDVHPAYQAQLDTYTLLLDKTDRPCGDTGCLVYYYPNADGEFSGSIPFTMQVKPVTLNPDAALENFRAAVKCVEGYDMPESANSCEYCKFVADREKVKE